MFKYRGTENSSDFMFKYRETAILVVCYLNLEEQQPWNCVIQIQRNNSAGSVLFKYRGTTMLKMCYSNTEKQQCWNCVIQIQRNSNDGIV